MNEILKIRSVKKIVDSYTFQPFLLCEVLLPIELTNNINTGLSESTLTKIFYDMFVEGVKAGLEEDSKIIREYKLIPEAVSTTEGDFTIPFYWIDMLQMTMPTAICLKTGKHMNAMTVKSDIVLSKDDFYKLVYEPKDKDFLRILLKEQFAILRQEGYTYFYTGSFNLRMNPETEKYEYNLLLRVA